MTTTPRATVLMRSKNSDWVIGQALAGLFAQNYTDFELLVVDSGSTDRTLEYVAAYPCRLERIKPENYYPGAVLNQAIEGTNTELIVFLNSDCVPLCAETLGRLVAAFDDPSVMAAFGRQVPRPEADGWVRRDYAQAFPETGDAPPWITFSLPIAAIRRSAWEKRKFYTDAWGSEDTEWGNWARQQPGWKVAYVPEAITMHSHNYTLRQLYGRRFIEGEADAFIYRDR
ncbi:MAG: glycosyltransferase family A protein, partial [Capsulimonadales bacterium]|nr:glycosyltransferase family A protein [Capsulimonadales bacterium]